MSQLGFDDYVEPLKLYLQKYRESLKTEKTDKKETVGSFGASA
jgi:nuclear transcription Y subunit beta